MKFIFCYIITVLSTSLSFAQTDVLKSVDEVYSKYAQALGGKDKIISIFSIQSSQIGYDSNYRVASKRMEALDMSSKQFASIWCVFFNSKKTFQRFVQTHGKGYLVSADNSLLGPTPLPDEAIFTEGIFSDLLIKEGSKLLPNELINNEEAYVVNYKRKGSLSQELDVNDYFSANTGLLTVRKISYKGYFGIKEHYAFYSDYRSIGGIMFAHKILRCSDRFGKRDCSTLKYHEVLFNTDIEEFKNGFFKNYEKAIESIPD